MRLLLIVLAACGTAGHPTLEPDVDAPVQPPPPDSPGPVEPTTVFTIVLENHDYAEIVGSANAPYINSLISQGALATQWHDTNHPSLPNYLHMISGSDQYPGVVDVDPTQGPYFPAAADNLGTQLEAAGIAWRSYQEGMGEPCRLTQAYPYAPKHDPFLYFADMQSVCAQRNVDYSEFAADLASNAYRYMWITPNLLSDGHDPGGDPATALRNSDNWLAANIPAILASDGYRNGGMLIITWDEAEGRGNDPDLVPAIVLSPTLRHTAMQTPLQFTHASYLATVEDWFGLPRLPTVTAAPSLAVLTSAAPGTCDPEFHLAGHAGANSVWLSGDFVDWGVDPGHGAQALVKAADGSWSGFQVLRAGDIQYKLIIDGSTWIEDPANPNTVADGFGGHNSVYSCQP